MYNSSNKTLTHLVNLNKNSKLISLKSAKCKAEIKKNSSAKFQDIVNKFQSSINYNTENENNTNDSCLYKIKIKNELNQELDYHLVDLEKAKSVSSLKIEYPPKGRAITLSMSIMW